MRLVELENAACGGSGYRGRTTYPHRDVISLGVTGVSVKAIERAGENKRMKFVPLVEKKRVCRHVGHSTGEAHYTPKQVTQGDADFFRIALTEGGGARMVGHEVCKADGSYPHCQSPLFDD